VPPVFTEFPGPGFVLVTGGEFIPDLAPPTVLIIDSVHQQGNQLPSTAAIPHDDTFTVTFNEPLELVPVSITSDASNSIFAMQPQSFGARTQFTIQPVGVPGIGGSCVTPKRDYNAPFDTDVQNIGASFNPRDEWNTPTDHPSSTGSSWFFSHLDVLTHSV